MNRLILGAIACAVLAAPAHAQDLGLPLSDLLAQPVAVELEPGFEAIGLLSASATNAAEEPGPVCDAPLCADCAACDAVCPQCGRCPVCGKTKTPECPCQKAKKKAEELKKKVAGAYKPVFYDNDFSYVCDPAYCDWMPGDSLKRMCVTPWAVVDIGGQYRARYHSEHNIRNLGPVLGLTGADDDFVLNRTRLFANAQLGEFFRVYAEGIDADSNGQNLPPRVIEVNRTDMQNLFLDVKLYEDERGKLLARGGRQELLYGNQRLISPLDWANTRRTFEGGKLFWVGDDWNIDAIYVNPILPDPSNFDSPDYDQDIWGLYSTYKGIENKTFDFTTWAIKRRASRSTPGARVTWPRAINGSLRWREWRRRAISETSIT